MRSAWPARRRGRCSSQPLRRRWSVPASEMHRRRITKSSTRRAARRPASARSLPAAAKLPVPTKDALKFKPKAQWKFVGKERPIYDLNNIATGKAEFGLDVYRDGMVYASIEHPPVVGGTVKSLDDKAALAVKGVAQTVTIDAPKPPLLFQSLGGVAVDRQQHVGGDAGAEAAEGRVERRPACELHSRPRSRQQMIDDGEAAGEGGAQPRQRRRGVRQGRKSRRGGLLHADGGARGDGAAGRGRRIPQRQSRGVGADAEPAGGAGHRGCGASASTRRTSSAT